MKITGHSSTKEAGFTLVELLVAIIVGAIMVMSLNVIVNAHSYLSHRGKNLVLANSFVEGKVEALRSLGYLGLNNGTTDVTSELPPELTQPKNSSVVISDHTSSVKKIFISITYNEQGISRTYTYTTFVGELGVGQ